ncbi:MAG TPA: hypothetical protein VFH47_08615 [Candidatus Thermoplasmatota archaeon]|nr:hypothetical protein [Candidatus Thermoplasmatota archaeon]
MRLRLQPRHAIGLAVLALAMPGCAGPPQAAPPDNDVLRFHPDVQALLRDACAGALALPAPWWGVVELQRPPGAPAHPACHEVEAGGAAVIPFDGHVAGDPASHAHVIVGAPMLHGEVSLRRPDGPWGGAGLYRVTYEEEDGHVVARAARLDGA